MEESEIRLRVRYAETDQMGRAHHAHHLVWCEAGRTAWLRERGTSYREIESDGVYLPVSRLAVRYGQPVGYDEEVRVRTRLAEVRSRTLRFAYDVERVADDRLVAEVETELVCVDANGRVRRLPGRLREALGEDGGG